MNANTVIGYTGDASAYHPQCAETVYTDLEGNDHEGNPIGAIFAGSEWDYTPTCDVCHEPIEGIADISDSATIAAAISEAEAEEREIDLPTARLIASQWHGGGGSRLYSFASTGVMHYGASETWGEVADCYRPASKADRLALDWLGTYLVNREIGRIDPDTGKYID